MTIHPHSHEENTIIERAVQEVQRHLRNIVFDIRVKHEWSLYLPLIQRIMNATIHTALGCAQANIIYGRALELDQNLLPLLQSRLFKATQIIHIYVPFCTPFGGNLNN